jgi:predicted ATP-grasp superfamily ATP-dependent carboligase
MALAIAQSLASRGVEVIGCDDVDMTVMSFSRAVSGTFVHRPAATDPEGFIEDLEAAILERKPTDGRPYVLMPSFQEARLIAKHKARLAPHISVATPDYESILAVDPKDNLLDTARRLGLRIPETWRPEEIVDKGALPYPVLTKPCSGVGGRGIEKASTVAELEALLEEESAPSNRLLVQQCVEGQDYCVTVLFDRGALKAIAAYRNIVQFPAKTGAGALRETIDSAPFTATVEALFGALDWTGVAEVDFRWDGENEPWLIEVNPRFWAGLFHSMETGADFPWMLYELSAFGQVSTAAEPEIGAKTKVAGLWLLGALQDIADSDDHFGAARDAWAGAVEKFKTGKLLDAATELGRAARESVDFSTAAPRIRQAMLNAKGAPTDLFRSEDPLVSLGALFVVTSLLRHGKLPPEILFDPKAPDLASV